MISRSRQPMRSCVACRTGADKRALVRFVRSANEQAASATTPRAFRVFLDTTGRMPGRGAYLCEDPSCFERARKTKALERALRCSLTAAEYEQLQEVFIDLCDKKHNSIEAVTHGQYACS